MSDSLGFFKIERLPSVNGLLKLQALGYTPIERPLHLDELSGAVALGDIAFTTSEVAIEQVRVAGEAPFLMLKPNRKVLTPQAEDLASGASVAEVLKRLPDFEVSPTGE